MKYQTGGLGRCIVARFDDGDPVLQNLETLAKKEKIRAAVVYLVGCVTEATLVVGPDKEELPPAPGWEVLESHETLGIGTIFREGNEPRFHFHGSFGKRDNITVSCLRGKANTFLVLEAIILEITGVTARRELDPKSNMALLKL